MLQKLHELYDASVTLIVCNINCLEYKLLMMQHVYRVVEYEMSWNMHHVG